ncbi:zf-HC2 domain-containing protein [Mycolicibacterium neworleansense]|uniref:Putative transmembrane anti-sigma factor n=1 Tax=Mycolicibacterium neworleansense TaxID=146018 RepID=A0A0H5RT10_9MYCO|nr:zf-HC2 domain-containing protein [Mycolicibacterium neworleansense]MCV7360107.1 zf-HC2 domain-containing protein [Mycolicibacterium neworleansense]CRZ17290.1 putative transmembrane anti-sigma factor [Mycolicibacterium neworleansense]
MIDEPHVLLGAYILGGLDAEERARFETHLKECAQCRAQAADFAPLPSLLSKADPVDLETGPTDGGEAVLALGDMLAARRAAANRRRIRRRVAVGACAAVLAAVALVFVIPRGETPPPGTGTFAMQSVSAAGASGSVTLTPKPWGTAIVLNLQKLPTDGVFTLRTMDDSGAMQPAATWAAMPTGAGVVQGATSIPMPKLRKLNIVDANNTVLATVER